MNTLYGTETFTEDFEIDIAHKGGCKGLIKVEVVVTPWSVPLLLKDGSEQRITTNAPFVLQSTTHPITNGLLRFAFSEFDELEEYNPNKEQKKAIVRYLYCE